MGQGRALAAALAALVLAGCGDHVSITGGGRVAGDRLTVYSFLPHAGPRAAAARQIELGEKLALAQAHGRAGGFVVDYATTEEPVGRYGEAAAGPIASAVRDMVTDQAMVAVIGDLDAGTARTSVPLLDAAGILHVSPGTNSTTFANPSGRRTFFSLAPTAAEQAAALPRPVRVEAEASDAAQNLAEAVGGVAKAPTTFYAGYDAFNADGVAGALRGRVILSADFASTDLRYPTLTNLAAPPAAWATAFTQTFPGKAADPWAYRGWQAMRGVLAAIDAAGPDARNRQAVIDAYADEQPAAAPVRISSG